MAKNDLGTCVCCSNVFSTGYFVSCHMQRWRSESERSGGRAADLFVELAEVVADFVLRLYDDGVLLELLCCGHLGAEGGG